jgi:signal transduction histidine kinase/DNA-binding response OmpR family regulator
MKLVWKLSIPQICIVLCLGLVSFIVINASVTTMRTRYVEDLVENCFKRITKEIEVNAQEAIKQTALFVRLPVVARAYKLALSGNIDAPYSPQSQAARELLRKELAPMLDSYRDQFGNRLRLHFHLPNARSLVRLWRDKNTRIKGENVDVSDDLASYRPTVLDVLRHGKKVMGIELGSGGFAVRGVMPVHAPDGNLLGTAEILQDCSPILDAVMEDEKIEFVLYVNKERIAIATDARNPAAIATELQDPKKNPHKGDFVRVTTPKNEAMDALVSPALLSKGKTGRIFEYHGPVALATLPILDYRGTQLGVLVCAMRIEAVTRLTHTIELTLLLLLACMALLPFTTQLLGLRMFVTGHLNLIKNKIQDITEDRADLSEQLPVRHKDEIGDLAMRFNTLTAKLNTLMAGLREADTRMRVMLDATPLGAKLWDEHGNLIYTNQEATEMFGVSGTQEYDERLSDISPQYQPCGKTSIGKRLEVLYKAFTEGYNRFEWMHQKPNGEPIPCEIILVRIKDKESFLVAGYTIDLRERNTMLKAIRDESTKHETQAHWYASILDAIPFPISVQDAKMQWTFINAPLEKLLGKTRQDVLGIACNTWGISLCGTDACAIACAQRGLKQTYFLHQDASYQVDVEILRDLRGNTSGFLEVIQDVTQLEQLAKQQAEAENVSQAKSAFLARVSHEIRTPMNAVLGITEIQLQNEMLPADTQEAFRRIYTAGYTLLGIINDILDLSRMEAGKVELMPAKYEIASLIHDTVQLNIVRIGSKRIEFKLEMDEDIPSVLFGDDLRIRQILNNLLSNAIKYTLAGEVVLSVSAEYEHGEDTPDVILVCRVRDTGQGMTEEQLDRLCDEYSRFALDANRTIEGIGLGMNITRQLVQMMNGEMLVESTLGTGSTFTVRIPQERISPNILGKELAESMQHFEIGMPHMNMAQIVRDPMPYGRVLVVDDLETNLYVTRGLMAPYGLSVDIAMSGFGAINKIREGNLYDIVFMDHMMPRMDGVEATAILRDMGYTRPIVALTANAVVGQAEMFLENGFDGFLSKPVDLRQLNAVLNRLIRDKQPPEVLEAARRQKGSHVDGGQALQPSENRQFAAIFARDATRAATALETIHINQYRRDDDMHMFVINVHSMKSALANIGETELAAVAAKLEQAGRSQEIAVMTAETPAFLGALRAVVEKIRPDEEAGNGEATDEDPAYLREKLSVIQTACATYDKKAVKDALAELMQKAWSHQTREQLDTIAEHLLHSDFEEAAGVAEKLIAANTAQGHRVDT